MFNVPTTRRWLRCLLLFPEACVSHEEEHSWIRAAQAGNTQAYAGLVDRYWPRVQRWLQGLIQDVQAAEDPRRTSS